MNVPLSGLAVADDGIFSFLHTIKGPEFLALYVGWFLFTRMVVGIFRSHGHDTPLTSFVGLLSFELVGVVRIIVGSAHGMHKWEILVGMMIFGALAFFSRADNSSSSSDSGGSWWSSCSGSDSSGGGGDSGGGGGCGGCGGD